ncbi:MAG TPA: DUF3427 domain-containing protein, partial [Nannocystis exedens]|nr:DUF3427 domain-containing protein [Nannocystis exedens]
MAAQMDPLATGLYEQVIDERLAVLIASMENRGFRIEEARIDRGEAHETLSIHLQRLLARVLRSLAGEARIELVNALLALVSEAAPGVLPLDEAEIRNSILKSLRAPAPLAANKCLDSPLRPGIPLDQSALLVNANREWRIGAELGREIDSADRIDLLCSFLKVSGYNTLREPIRRFLAKGGTLRVLTSTYIGATERQAVEMMARDGADIRISYDTHRSPLHAKAWIFHRNSGYSTAYIGSSNLSARALKDGLEWNVRASAISTRGILEQAIATFESYWTGGEFKTYSPKRDADVLARALAKARGSDETGWGEELPLFDLAPYTFQVAILERLERERVEHGRHRNLVVAATGTGKTMIAAFDYERLARAARERPSLLFVAHRETILRQSRAVFRQVLRDPSFGELHVAGERPQEGRHVFASIQSLRGSTLKGLAADDFQIVVVDEFHHAAATTYDRLLAHLQPRELLGLTATPERADGKDILGHFGGRIAAEIRLWDAIGRALLCPFQYFGIRDSVDLDHLDASRGCYRTSDLDALY